MSLMDHVLGFFFIFLTKIMKKWDFQFKVGQIWWVLHLKGGVGVKIGEKVLGRKCPGFGKIITLFEEYLPLPTTYPYIPLLSYSSITPYPTLLHKSNPLRYSTIPTQPKDWSEQWKIRNIPGKSKAFGVSLRAEGPRPLEPVPEKDALPGLGGRHLACEWLYPSKNPSWATQ